MAQAAWRPEAPRDSLVRSKQWQVRFDTGRNWRAKIGFVLIPNEQTIEDDMVRMAPEGVGIYFSRAVMPHRISTATLAHLTDSLSETAGRILPDDNLDVICFACTSGSVAVGETLAVAELNKGAPGAKATTLVTSVKNALHQFNARRIVVGTPYVDELNTNVARNLIEGGFEIVNFQGLGLNYDREMIRVSPDFLVEFAQAIDCPDADALLLSCGALRSVEVVDEIEQRTKKPVVVSNQAMIWECLRLAGVDDRIDGYGRLLKEF
ncbi:MAG: arylmalonate decarboxylase [Gemmatimonadales bacterium]